MSILFPEQDPSLTSTSHDSTQYMDERGYCSWSNEEDLEDEYHDEDCDQDPAGGYDDSEYYDDDENESYSDYYGDFSVKALAPPPPPRPRPSPSGKPVSKNSKTGSKIFPSSSDRQSPIENTSDKATLTLPAEVLHLIFSYLDNTTLCHGVSYVSRQFNAIAKYYIECIWTLGSQMDEDILLEKLRVGKVKVLKIRYSLSAPKDSGRLQPFDEWDWAWKKFRDLITQPISVTLDAPDKQATVDSLTLSTETMTISDERDRAPYLLHGVKKLITDGGDLWTPEYLPTLLPFMHSIHTLVLKPWSWSQSLIIPLQSWQSCEIPLLSVLETCPSIDTLVISGAVSLCWNEDARPESTQDTWRAFRLSRFIATNATTTQETMEKFMSACPQLVSFHAKHIHVRLPGTACHDLLTTPSLPVEPLLQCAALLCPNLVDLSITPIACTSTDTFESLLARCAQLFSRTKHLDIRAAVRIDPSWVPTSRVANFLAQVTSIEFVRQVHAAQEVDRLLKHTHALECLKSWGSSYSRLREIEYSSLEKDIFDGVVAARLRRGQRPSNCFDRSRSYEYCYGPLYLRKHSKLSQKVSKRLVHKQMMERRYTTLVASWRCVHLREMELNVPDVGSQEGVFRFLVHACPNVEQLTLHLSELKVGQADRAVEVTYEKGMKKTMTRYRPRAPRHRKCSWTYDERRAISIEYWTTHESTLKVLGGLLRLEMLVLRCHEVKGVLCPKDFEFMRKTGPSRGGGGGSSRGGIESVNDGDGRVFCPRLKELRVESSLQFHCGLLKEKVLVDKASFVNALRSMRPEVEFRF